MTPATADIAKTLLAIALLSSATQIPAAQPASPLASDNALRTTLDGVVDTTARDFFRNTCHVGLSLAVVTRRGSTFYNYGSTTRDGATLPDARSVYEIASVTKTFTGALAARALVDGRMQLDADFRAYLPAGPYPDLAWQGTPITLRSLLTHRAGMPRDIPDSDAIFARKDFDTLPRDLLALQQGLDNEKLQAALHDVRLRSKPGDTEAYSNAGFFVLGLGLEKVYGQSFEALMKKKLLDPLRMASTGFVLDRSMRAHRVPPYDRKGRIVPDHPRNAGAAWGLYSSSVDMARYVRWQLDGDDPVIRAMRKPLVGDAHDGVAMTWHLADDDGESTLSHGGGSFGMTSEVVLYPTRGQGYVLLANDACEGTEGALHAMAVAIQARSREADAAR